MFVTRKRLHSKLMQRTDLDNKHCPESNGPAYYAITGKKSLVRFVRMLLVLRVDQSLHKFLWKDLLARERKGKA